MSCSVQHPSTPLVPPQSGRNPIGIYCPCLLASFACAEWGVWVGRGREVSRPRPSSWQCMWGRQYRIPLPPFSSTWDKILLAWEGCSPRALTCLPCHFAPTVPCLGGALRIACHATKQGHTRSLPAGFSLKTLAALGLVERRWAGRPLAAAYARCPAWAPLHCLRPLLHAASVRQASA